MPIEIHNEREDEFGVRFADKSELYAGQKLFLISSGYRGIGNGVFECGSAKAQSPGPVDPGEVEATLCYGYRVACDPPANEHNEHRVLKWLSTRKKYWL